jgi:hypothetical protein
MSAPITQSIPFIAGDNTWESWNGSMLHYFGEEPLPRVDEETWQDFARSMGSLATFSTYGIPGPEGYETWQDWVSSVIGLINGPTE